MTEKLEKDLKIINSENRLPTLEIDLDSIPHEYFGYGDIVGNGLRIFANKNPKINASIYVYQGMSINFHENTFSAFFGVDSKQDIKILEYLLIEFKKIRGVTARLSDYITSSDGFLEFHIEGGIAWRPLDAEIWYSIDEDEDEDEDEDIFQESEEEIENTRVSIGSRFRRARSDASVATIKKSIENIFGLPEGSVLLCNPNGKPIRPNAKIRTLRSKWENEG